MKREFKTMDAIKLLVSDARGIYIPQTFVEKFDVSEWGIPDEDGCLLTVRRGPEVENEGYWEAWDSILDRAEYDQHGFKFRLHQDGDLWAICEELMTDEEYENFFGEMR